MSRAKRIYIAGPMRGLPDHNFPAFNAATGRFRAWGWTVYNPVEIGEKIGNGNPGIPGSEFLREDVCAIALCGAIALLPGWERSTGARCEVALAVTIGLDFYDAESLQPIEPPSRVVVCGGYERPAGAVNTLDALRDDVCGWANAQFTAATPASKAEHLRREVLELCDDPTDVEEMADVFILLSHLSDGRDLVGAVRAKLEKNKARTWGTPDADGVVEHVAEGAGT